MAQAAAAAEAMVEAARAAGVAMAEAARAARAEAVAKGNRAHRRRSGRLSERSSCR